MPLLVKNSDGDLWAKWRPQLTAALLGADEPSLATTSTESMPTPTSLSGSMISIVYVFAGSTPNANQRVSPLDMDWDTHVPFGTSTLALPTVMFAPVSMRSPGLVNTVAAASGTCALRA
jgi:hypothetical protein